MIQFYPLYSYIAGYAPWDTILRPRLFLKYLQHKILSWYQDMALIAKVLLKIPPSVGKRGAIVAHHLLAMPARNTRSEVMPLT